MPPALCLPISWQPLGNGPFLTVFIGLGEVMSGQEIRKWCWVQHWPVVFLPELVCSRSWDQLCSLLTLNCFFLLFCLFLFFSLLIDHSFFLSKSQPTKDTCERIFCSYPGIKKLMWYTAVCMHVIYTFSSAFVVARPFAPTDLHCFRSCDLLWPSSLSMTPGQCCPSVTSLSTSWPAVTWIKWSLQKCQHSRSCQTTRFKMNHYISTYNLHL